MIVVGGLKFGAIYSLAALGIVVIYKATRIVNFAHGAFVLAGAYATYGIVEVLHIGYWPAYVLVPIATGLLAAAVELGMLRPIRQADMFALITSTIFIGIGLSEVYRLVQNTEMLGLRNPVPGPPIFIGDVIITKEQIWVLVGHQRVDRCCRFWLRANRPRPSRYGGQCAWRRTLRIFE
jgi:branched-chain amino acid transport system permease protein